jgi:DNA-binding transcriptional MerR regulator
MNFESLNLPGASIGQPLAPDLDPIAEGGAFLIGQVGQLLDLQASTIRFYEQLGLVVPKRVGRLRVYGKDDLKTLQFVKYLRELGVSLQSIRKLLQDSAGGQLASLDAVEVRQFLSVHLAEMKAARANLSTQIDNLTAVLGSP